MPAVQTSYIERHTEINRPGTRASAFPSAVSSYVVEPGNEVLFGRGVAQGTADDECQPYNQAADRFIGVAEKSTTQNNENDKYIAGSHVKVMSRGDIWVEKVPGLAVGIGDTVSVSHASGQVGRFTTGTSNATLVPGANFLRAAAASDTIAVIRLATGQVFT